MHSTEILFYAAEIVLVLSYSATRMIVLRFMACAADIGYMVAAFLIGLGEAGMTPTFLFAAIAFIINAAHIFRLLKMRIPATVPPQLLAVYNSKFAALTAREFLHLMKVSANCHKTNQTIIVEGRPCDIYLTLDGELAVQVQGKEIARLPAASVVGEVSALTGIDAMATVTTVGSVSLCSWNKESRDELEKHHPELSLKFQKILLGEMRAKLHLQNLSQLALPATM